MTTRTIDDRVQAREIREWGRANGHEVSDKGALPRHLVDLYIGAHGGSDVQVDDEPGWGSAPGPADPLDQLEAELSSPDGDDTGPGPGMRDNGPPGGSTQPAGMTPVTSLDEARQRIGAGQARRPGWAGQSPRTQRQRSSQGEQPRKPVTKAVRDDVTGKLTLLLSPLAMGWQMADPYCGGAFAENLDEIVIKAVPLLCMSPAVVEFFQKSSLIWAIFELTIALQPVGVAVYKHHVRRDVNEMGQRIDRAGRVVREPQRQAETVVADQSMYVTEVSGHVPPARPAGAQ